MTTNPNFKIEMDGPIAWLVLNRPEKRNAMGLSFFPELATHIRALDQDPAVRVVVLKAEGKSFTAGLDLTEAGGLLLGKGANERERLRRNIVELQESFSAVEKCAKPVIAADAVAVHGGGVDLLAACDIRLCSADAVFSIRETRIAIIADLGTLQRLPTIIGHGWARELALTGRDWTAAEALQMGFVTHVLDDRQALYAEAKRLAGQIAANAPLSVQGVKDVMVHGRDNGVYAGLGYVAQKNAAQLPSDDLMEAVTAFMEKRLPAFTGK